LRSPATIWALPGTNSVISSRTNARLVLTGAGAFTGLRTGSVRAGCGGWEREWLVVMC